MNKYKNKKVEFECIVFDSEMELKFYKYLLTKYSKEEIVLQPKFLLQESFRDNQGILQRKIEYIADFMILDTKEVIDVKGFQDQKFPIKKKLFLYKFREYTLKLLTAAPKYTGKEWIELDELKKVRKGRKNNGC